MYKKAVVLGLTKKNNMQNEINDMKIRISELENTIKLLNSSTTIPYDVGEAIRERIGANIVGVDIDTTTQTKTVDESGSQTYTVAKTMDGMITVKLNSNIYKIPYYN